MYTDIFMYTDINLIISALVGIVSGYYITRLLKRREKTESLSFEAISKSREVIKTEKSIVNEIKEPKDFADLVKFLRDKFMLSEVTLSTYEGLPIASTLDDPEEISALAPEILKDVGKNILKSKEITIGGKAYKMSIFEVTPDVICTIQSTRDIPFVEIEKIREEIREFMEVRS